MTLLSQHIVIKFPRNITFLVFAVILSLKVVLNCWVFWQLYLPFFNLSMGTLKPQSNGPSYSNTVISTLAIGWSAVTFGTAWGAWEGWGLTQSLPHWTKCNRLQKGWFFGEGGLSVKCCFFIWNKTRGQSNFTKSASRGGPFLGYGSPQGVEICTIEFLG